MALKSVFNFVPLNKKVYCPNWGKKDVLPDRPFQDVPFQDGEDGTISFEIKNVSPLFIRNGKKDNPMPSHIEENGGWRFLIPATSLKGMLRATLEVFAFAKLTQYQNRYFGWRDFNREDYKDQVDSQRCGWIYKKGEQYMIDLCFDDFEKIEMSKLPSKVRGRSSYQRNTSMGWYPLLGNKRIVCTGDMNGKEHEYLFPDYTDTYEPEALSKDVVDKFLTIYENTPDFEKYLQRLDKNEKVAVFVLLDPQDEIKLIGLASQQKLAYRKGIKDLVQQKQSNGEDLDLCETIFGYTNGDADSLRGRVQVGVAKTSVINKDIVLSHLIKGVLGMPKPSYYPLYLRQNPNDRKYVTYDNASSIAGRKFYRIRQGETTERIIENENNSTVNTSFRPIKPGQVFTCKINVHNLRPIETGAILSALLLHKTQGVYHNLGLAKGYGYGKIEINNVSLNGFKKSVDEYLGDFEKEMNQFLEGKKWNESQEVLSLLKILSEHKPAKDLGVMTLKEYREAKKKQKFDTLKESNNVVCPSFIK